MLMPDHRKFWILHLADAIALLVCFKKEKKYMESNIQLATVWQTCAGQDPSLC